MKKKEQATVIIPCFNLEDNITDCLNSVKLQADSAYHPFVMANSATENTIAKVGKWQRTQPASIPRIFEKRPGHVLLIYLSATMCASIIS